MVSDEVFQKDEEVNMSPQELLSHYRVQNKLLEAAHSAMRQSMREYRQAMAVAVQTLEFCADRGNWGNVSANGFAVKPEVCEQKAKDGLDAIDKILHQKWVLPGE